MESFIILLILLLLGFSFGQYAEKKHFRNIFHREEILRNVLLIPEKKLPDFNLPPTTDLVYGNVVISIDYFKRFSAGLRMIFGGRLGSYETLLERARREAILRMKEQAQTLGAKAIFNIKLETASISKGAKNTIGSVEVLAYGTALIPPTQLYP